LGQSIYESLHHTGYGWQKKEELHKLAITYRTSSRFRWWS
jgi:hypothetical protein